MSIEPKQEAQLAVEDQAAKQKRSYIPAEKRQTGFKQRLERIQKEIQRDIKGQGQGSDKARLDHDLKRMRVISKSKVIFQKERETDKSVGLAIAPQAQMISISAPKEAAKAEESPSQCVHIEQQQDDSSSHWTEYGEAQLKV